MEQTLRIGEFGLGLPGAKTGLPTHMAAQNLVRTFFTSVPPERLGLDGEYDHSGLAKRVRLHLLEKFGAKALERLSISQRGRVVVIEGTIASSHLLRRMVSVAELVYGASDVETHGVCVGSVAANSVAV